MMGSLGLFGLISSKRSSNVVFTVSLDLPVEQRLGFISVANACSRVSMIPVFNANRAT